MSESIKKYIRMQEIGPVIGNLIINPLLAWLANPKMESITLFGDHSVIIDTAITSIVASLLVTMFAASGVRRDLKAGRVAVPEGFPPAQSPLFRLPQKSWTLGLVFGICIAAVLVPTFWSVFRLCNITRTSFGTFLVIKAVYTGVLGFVVARWAILRELAANRRVGMPGG